MERALIEEITRLVISKLKEEENQALTQDELERWRQISTILHGDSRVEKKAGTLSEQELKQWHELTLKLQTVTKNHGEEDRAKFVSHR